MAKSGRPPLAAKSFDEALQLASSWHPPLLWKRPRNHFERQAHDARRRDIRFSPASKTALAAHLTAYLMKTEHAALAPAARRAASAYGVNADNVRKYARELLAAPTVELSFRGAAWAPVGPCRAPLLVEVRDAVAEDFLPFATQEGGLV